MKRLVSISIFISLLFPFIVLGQGNKTLPDVRQLFLTKQWCDSTNNIFNRTEIYKASDIAIIVVDMWDAHWCKSMNKKASVLIPKMNRTLDAARELGIKIIFAPTETVDFYDKYPQRQRIKNLKKIQPLQVNVFNPPPLPWGRTGGCECGPDRPCQEKSVWTRQNEALPIKDDDLISDKVDEINTFCKLNGIKTLIFVGEASNMCVTWTRSFSIIPMIRYGYETIVVRDLVEAISGNGYDPDRRVKDPFFTPEKGADSTLKHIEKYICNTISANQILLAVGKEVINRPKLLRIKMYTKEFVKNYQPKGRNQSFRQQCYDYNLGGWE